MRITSQREEILNYLKSVKTHPTAEEIYHNVKKKLTRISLGTVYRNLEFLKEQGLILEIDIHNKSRFDGDVSEHHHFICNKCGKIIDLMIKLPAKFVNEVKTMNKGLKIKNAIVKFNGLCDKCGR